MHQVIVPPFLQRCDLHDTVAGTPPNLILIDSSASTIQAYLVLRFPTLRQVSPLQFAGALQGIAPGTRISNFLRAFFMVC